MAYDDEMVKRNSFLDTIEWSKKSLSQKSWFWCSFCIEDAPSVKEEGVYLSKQKVTFWIEEAEVELLKEKFNTDNQSETIRLAILQSPAIEDLEMVKILINDYGCCKAINKLWC